MRLPDLLTPAQRQTLRDIYESNGGMTGDLPHPGHMDRLRRYGWIVYDGQGYLHVTEAGAEEARR